MNIKDAKRIVSDTVKIYLQKDGFGEYSIPRNQRRPVMLIGAPGLGKTDIMRQIAAETGLPLLSYTMTHLTRQSLIGLPTLKEAVFSGKAFSVTENTLSDMMTSILRMQEVTGKNEGLLFLDEVNCVSETLAATMLDLLQNKRIGNHEIPDGWVLVTAGNPPQYNKSVREYDVATLDRLRTVYVDPDFSVWKEYALAADTHPAIISFLEGNEDNFYKVSSTVDGKRYATARGWSDLSVALRAYEKAGLPVSDELIIQYITIPDIARKFSVYYDLFRKYRMDYSVQDILEGKVTDSAIRRGSQASFDERLAVVSMLMEAVNVEAKSTMTLHDSLQDVVKALRKIKKDLSGSRSVADRVREYADSTSTAMAGEKAANMLSAQKKEVYMTSLSLTGKYLKALDESADNTEQFKVLKSAYTKDVKALDRKSGKTARYLANAFGYIEKAFGNEMEMTLFTTSLTSSQYTSSYIFAYGCEEYYQHNGSLMVLDVNKKLTDEIDSVLPDAASI